MRTIFILLVLFVALLNAAVFRSDVLYRGKVKRSSLRGAKRNREMRLNGHRKATAAQPVGDYWDDLYLVNVTYGTPPQEFSLILDTIDAATWVIDAKCTSLTCTGGPTTGYRRRQFDSTKSSTYAIDEQNVTLNSDLWFDIFGDIGNDTFGLSSFVLKSQSLFIGTNLDEAEDFKYLPADGILGLGEPLRYADHLELSSVLTDLQPYLDSPMYTIWYARNERSVGSFGGTVTYGGYDTEHCSSFIQWVPLEPFFWLIDLQTISFGNFSDNPSVERNYYIRVASADAYLNIPMQYAGKLAEMIGAWKDEDLSYLSYFVKCTARDTAPPIVFSVSGVEIAIPASEYIVDENIGNGVCEMKVSDLSEGSNLLNVGAPLLRTYCTTIDFAGNRAGFAVAKQS